MLTKRHPMSINLLKYNCINIKFSRLRVDPLSDMPILGSSNSVAHKDMMSKIWKNGNTMT